MRAISDVSDVIVFELLNGEFSSYPHALGSMCLGQTYKQLGVGPDRTPTWKDGTISERHGMSNFFTDVNCLI